MVTSEGCLCSFFTGPGVGTSGTGFVVHGGCGRGGGRVLGAVGRKRRKIMSESAGKGAKSLLRVTSRVGVGIGVGLLPTGTIVLGSWRCGAALGLTGRVALLG